MLQKKNIIICSPVTPFFFNSRGGEGREGGSMTNLYYICFIHVVDMYVISVYDYWTMSNCSVQKRAARALYRHSVIPHHAFLHHQALATFGSFLVLCCICTPFTSTLFVFFSQPLFSCFFLSFLPSLPASLLPSSYCTSHQCLSQKKQVIFKSSSDIEKPNCHECVCVCATHSWLPEATHDLCPWLPELF